MVHKLEIKRGGPSKQILWTKMDEIGIWLKRGKRVYNFFMDPKDDERRAGNVSWKDTKDGISGSEILKNTVKKRNGKKPFPEDVKTLLITKYRETFIDKLTRQDLEELQFYQKNQYDKERGWNSEYRKKFEFKLRQYFHEEILLREIASIETLLGLLQPKDLKIWPLGRGHFFCAHAEIWFFL